MAGVYIMAGVVPDSGMNSLYALWEVPLISVCHVLFYCLF